MKIKTIINEEDIYEIARYNPKTIGTHILIAEGEENSKKRDYSNIVLLTLLYKRGFFKKDYDQMISDSNAFVSEYEKDEVMGL